MIPYDEIGVIPVLNFATGEQDEDRVRHDEDNQDDPEDDSPLLQRLLGRYHANDVRCDDTSEGTNSVYQRHQGARIIGTEIQPVNFHSGVEGTFGRSKKEMNVKMG